MLATFAGTKQHMTNLYPIAMDAGASLASYAMVTELMLLCGVNNTFLAANCVIDLVSDRLDIVMISSSHDQA